MNVSHTRVALVGALMILPAGAKAGSIGIGIDTLVGGTKVGTCHVTTFTGPSDRVAAYRKTQAERFAVVDEAAVAEMEKVVRVSLDVQTYKQNYCARDSGVPERIILTAKGSKDPILTIPLETEKVPLSNMMGATFVAVNAWATIPKETISSLIDKELDFHLVYSDHAYKDKWKKEYAAKILNAGGR